jgi:uncharacterized protein (DUF488 family)
VATLYTIGFTGTSAASFFGRLWQAGVRRLVDVRLHNTSQLAGFAKRDDLAFFCAELLDAEYVHDGRLAPDEELFRFVKKDGGAWAEYERRFLELLAERRVESTLDPSLLLDRPTALLCSEPKAVRCHRRRVAEYLASRWGGLEVAHL